jgi:hypothetical protein
MLQKLIVSVSVQSRQRAFRPLLLLQSRPTVCLRPVSRLQQHLRGFLGAPPAACTPLQAPPMVASCHHTTVRCAHWHVRKIEGALECMKFDLFHTGVSSACCWRAYALLTLLVAFHKQAWSRIPQQGCHAERCMIVEPCFILLCNRHCAERFVVAAAMPAEAPQQP